MKKFYGHLFRQNVNKNIEVNKLIKVDGYKAFRGTMRINTVSQQSFDIYGDWLYKPEAGCWYNKMSSYPERICEIVKDETDFGD